MALYTGVHQHINLRLSPQELVLSSQVLQQVSGDQVTQGPVLNVLSAECAVCACRSECPARPNELALPPEGP